MKMFLFATCLYICLQPTGLLGRWLQELATHKTLNLLAIENYKVL